jgi:hypothetical protein
MTSPGARCSTELAPISASPAAPFVTVPSWTRRMPLEPPHAAVAIVTARQATLIDNCLRFFGRIT